MNRLLLLLVAPAICTSLPGSLFGQSWKPLVGYTELVAEYGSSLENGSGVVVMQVEAPEFETDEYLPDENNIQFTGKTIHNGTIGGLPGPSGHATSVGITFYGNNRSIGNGITDITGFDANDYINRVLAFDTGGEPLAQGFDVGVHAYAVRPGGEDPLPTDVKIDLLKRFDYVINRDNTVMVVGADNEGTVPRPTPDLWATSYNAITAGVSDGTHSNTMTTDYGAGRFKPDIVVPHGTSPSTSFTSGATAVVGGAAAMLREAGAGTNAIQNEVIRSILFSGATKEEFSDWDRTTTRPVDEVYGFGELNIKNSYDIIRGGEFEASSSDPANNIGNLGWDYGDFDGANELFYDFSILSGEAAELSAALVWNVEIIDIDSDPDVFDSIIRFANLDLELFDSSGTFLGTLIDQSLSTVYNYEHIYLTNLAAGDYTFRISGDLSTDYGFSWRIDSAAIPEPSSATALALTVLFMCSRRRKR